MQISVTTDYAIRVIMYLGLSSDKKSASQISEHMEIPRKYIDKILTKLKKDGYLSADKGIKGGYYLNKELKNITIGQVLRSMEPDTKINRCLEEDCYCNLKATEICKIRKYYCKIQKLFEDVIFNITLQDIQDEKYNIDKLFD